jgi:PIN domain nuclease of toxin-antitoxin system
MQKMNKVILDASAFLALVNNETGKDVVEPLLPYSIMSSVNISEVVSELNSKLSLPIEHIQKILCLIPEVYQFDKNLAIQAGLLKRSVSHLGLSLGDRVCLALADHLTLTVYTADKAWSKLHTNITITQIR